MTFQCSTKKEARRIALAVETMTGHAPGLFPLDGGRYRVQENEDDRDWEEALEALLATGTKAVDCTRERVEQQMEAMTG